MNQDIIARAIDYVKDVFAGDASGHDHFHTLRVYKMAVRLAQEEGADEQIVALAALLHDVDDRKLSPETTKEKTVQGHFCASRVLRRKSFALS